MELFGINQLKLAKITMSDLSAIFIKITKNMHITSMTDSFNSLKSVELLNWYAWRSVAISV